MQERPIRRTYKCPFCSKRLSIRLSPHRRSKTCKHCQLQFITEIVIPRSNLVGDCFYELNVYNLNQIFIYKDQFATRGDYL